MVRAPKDYPPELLPFADSSPIAAHPWLRHVRHLQPTFAACAADLPRPSDTKGGKLLVEVAGKATFGELAILRAFQAHGWDGRWIDNYPLPPTFRLDYWSTTGGKLPRAEANVALPPEVDRTYRAICERAGDPRGGGAWDVIAWRGDEMVFVEAKRRKSSDWIKDQQIRWLEAARDLGVPRECMLFVEWAAASPQA